VEDRQRYENDLFRRYEARIVALEIQAEAARTWRAHYGPVVDELRETDRIAKAVADRLKEAQTMTFTRVQLVIAACALLIPPCLSAGLTILFLKR
jgi:hypothetical protein